jgi:hypothetical protein
LASDFNGREQRQKIGRTSSTTKHSQYAKTELLAC